MDPREVELLRSESDLAEQERSAALDANNARAQLAAATGRLVRLRKLATDVHALGGDTEVLARQIQQLQLPAMAIEPWVEKAIAARLAAVAARLETVQFSRAEVARVRSALDPMLRTMAEQEAALKKLREQAEAKLKAEQEAKLKAKPPPTLEVEEAELVTFPPPSPQEDAKPLPEVAVRGEKRVKMQAVVDFGSETNFYAGFSTNVSQGGLFVATVQRLAAGTDVDLQFTLPSGFRVQTKGRVRWTREVNDAHPEVFPGVGIQFVELDYDAQKAVEEFVKKREPLFFPD